MATALTAEGRDKLPRHLFGNASTPFPGCYLSLHSAQPGNSGASQISSGRQAVTFTWDATNKWYKNAAVSIASVSGSIQWVALWPAAGTGNVIFEGQLSVPVGISGTHSVVIPADTLRIYAPAPDASNKGGIADKGAELVLGHFLGVSSWTMPTSFYLRCHSADPTKTGNANVSYTHSPAQSVYLEDQTSGFWLGYDIIPEANSTRYWSATETSGNALAFGDCGSGNKSYYSVAEGDSNGGNGIDTSGNADSTFSGGAYNSLRVAFDVQTGIVNGDVNSGTMTAGMTMSGSVTPSLLSGTLVGSLNITPLISVGSTSVARGEATIRLNAQIGDSAPGVGFSVEGLLYDSLVTLQIL